MSVSSGDSDIDGPRSSLGPDLMDEDQSLVPSGRDVVHSILNGIRDDKDKLLLTSNVFCLLQHVQSRVFKSEACINVIEAAVSEVSRLQDKKERDGSVPPQLSKEQAKKWVKWPDGHICPPRESFQHRNEIERNRMRFEFWHLLRTDCLFRLSFGKPALLPEGSWAVNLPDPSITGVDDASTHFIQIHFLASMRLTLVVLKYLDWVKAESNQNAATYDSWLDDLITEVETIMADWNVEELISNAKNLIDTWFCADILFAGYRIIIVLSQAKNCNRDSYHLPRHTVDLARKSLKVFQSLMGPTVGSFWGIR
ncbi:transcription factor domain-containing protein [Aspergillus fumigatus Af293]|uniref:Fungal specific transcription factor n=2 Tax=Aspergillus fumigatus TaxID=746128 RepID=Q4WA91_ASPFU|nr:hypothetical protein AFUA_7G00470 [Aspergillus fumigatus Af293]EAL84845.1 hypothetical protein AFUA_7G00470 [Aspergillus fumigatus Af293]EDP47996.1 hypothetical protein AFUB_087050 [Aspergillus fumigatus A1163]